MLREHGVPASCDQTVPGILNRTKTGPCPMEACVAEIEDPQKAFFALREKGRRDARRRKAGGGLDVKK